MQAGSQTTQDLNQSKLKDRIVSGAVSNCSERQLYTCVCIAGGSCRGCTAESLRHIISDLQKESWSDKTSSEPGQGEGVIKEQTTTSAGGATGGKPAVEPTKADQLMTDPGQT